MPSTPLTINLWVVGYVDYRPVTGSNVKFEIYKLHAELAERVAALREDVSKLHSGLVSGIIAATVIAKRINPDSNELGAVLPLLGLIVSISWVVSIFSIRARVKAKGDTLRDLEKKIIPSFPFLVEEEQRYSPKKFLRRSLTSIVMPALFASLCVYLLVTDQISDH